MPEIAPLPPIAQSPISMILPLRDDATEVEAFLMAWMAYLDSLNRDYQIFAVDDASTDRTADLLGPWTERFPRLKFLRHPTRRGFGACLRTGLAQAVHPLLFYTSCSRSYQPADLQRLLDHIDLVHVASGKRAWKGRRPTWRERDWLQRWRARVLFGVRLRDVDSCFKLIRRSIFIRVPLQCRGSMVHTEILAKANFLGHVMTETDISYEAGPKPDVKWQDRSGRGAEVWDLFQHPDFGGPYLATMCPKPE